MSSNNNIRKWGTIGTQDWRFKFFYPGPLTGEGRGGAASLNHEALSKLFFLLPQFCTPPSISWNIVPLLRPPPRPTLPSSFPAKEHGTGTWPVYLETVVLGFEMFDGQLHSINLLEEKRRVLHLDRA